MLLTLNANCLRDHVLPPPGGGASRIPLLELPDFTREVLGLHGLQIPTDFLVGASRDFLGKFRERADKAGCACLVLVEREAHDFGSLDASVTGRSVERMRRVLEAAGLLGCNAAAVRVLEKPADPLAVDRIAANIRRVVDRADRLEVNLIIGPNAGFTSQPQPLTDLIKKVGGFHVGTFPDFAAAVESGDPDTYLKRLTPFAPAVNAAMYDFEDTEAFEGRLTPASAGASALADLEFDPDEEIDLSDLPEDDIDTMAPTHKPYDIRPLVRAIRAVGFDQTVAIDYRGTGEFTRGIGLSRIALEAAILEAADA